MPASLSPSIGSTTLTCQPRPSVTSSSMRLPSICNIFRESWQQDLNSPYVQLDSPETNNRKATGGFIDLTADSPELSYTSARIHRLSTTNRSTSRDPDYFASLDNLLDMPRRESTGERPAKRPRRRSVISRQPSPIIPSFPAPPASTRASFKIESSPTQEDSVIAFPGSDINFRRPKRRASQDLEPITIQDTILEPKDEQDRQLAEQIKSQTEASAGPTKLTQITCIICMDRIENMTATHCGHVFCHSCIQEALIAGENNTNGPKAPKCPMCRTKVNRRPRARQAPEMIPLCLKLKKKDKGKQKEIQ